MAGQRRLNADVRGLAVADFADHDDVRVGAQEGTQCRGEVEPDTRVHLHLAQAVLRDFNRVLGRPDLALGRVEFGQCGVQRSRLARAGRPDAQQQTVRLVQQPRESGAIFGGHAEAVEGNRLVRGEQPQHHVLAVARGRDGRHAQLDVALVHAQLDLAVLGFAPLGDVELGEHLDARRNGPLIPRRDAQVGITAAVLAEAHDGFAARGPGFDVDVRGAGPIGVRDDPVDEPDHGVVVLVRVRIEHRAARGGRAGFGGGVPCFLGRQLVEQGDPRRVGRYAATDRGNQFEHVLAQADHVGNRLAGKQPPHVLLALEILRVVGQHFHAAVHGAQRQPAIGAQIVRIDASEEFRRNGRVGAGLEERAAVEPAQRFSQLAFGHAERGHEHRFDGLARGAGRGRRLFELRRGQPPGGE